MSNEKLYMNAETGSVDTYEGWEDDEGNAVDRGEVIEVVQDDHGEWREV